MYPALAPGAIGVRLPFEECAALAAKAGFQGISVDPSGDTAMIGRVLEANKLRPASWGLPVEFRKDEATFQEGLKKLPAVAKAAKAIGATRCSTWILPFHDELTFEQNFQQLARRLGPCAEALGEQGCRFAVEFVGTKTMRDGHKYEFIHTQEGMLELIKAIGGSNVGLLFDSFHWYTSGGTRADIAKLTDALVVDGHINDAIAGRGVEGQIDNERALPGETGVIDLVGFLQGLKAIGYTGPVAPEPFSQRVRAMAPAEAIKATAEALLGVWRKAGV
ncbi:MAG: sugar phosphate isomerase/epimerase family protein [Armatimonadota bacterium]